jgi:hypothetical protein
VRPKFEIVGDGQELIAQGLRAPLGQDAQPRGLGAQKFGFVLTDDHQHISNLIGVRREMGGECGAGVEILRGLAFIERVAATLCRGSIQTPTQSVMSIRH